ncbi:hypothetical protein N9M85_00130 [Amylibacter sp.]|nr:hypothetical protein [Amylibacter sp.]
MYFSDFLYIPPLILTSRDLIVGSSAYDTAGPIAVSIKVIITKIVDLLILLFS